MNYRDLSIKTWNQLDISGNIVSGYKSILLSDDSLGTSSLHIFIDERSKYHFAVEVAEITGKNVNDPLVNGLTVGINNYRIGDGNIIRQVIDLSCSMQGYLEEFTEVVKEIAGYILDTKEDPADVVNRVIRNWKTFWANQNKQVLSEEEIIGLICELYVLRQLCGINVANALNSWTGPAKEKNDFSFTAWELEVKATRSPGIIHTINGIDQLKPSDNKSLAFISFRVSVTDTTHAVTLPQVIEEIRNSFLSSRPDLIIRFNELLAGTGYNPVHIKEYRNLKVEIVGSAFYVVEDTFPRFTSANLNEPLNSRITKVRYDISLAGIPGSKLDEINWGDYFY